MIFNVFIVFCASFCMRLTNGKHKKSLLFLTRIERVTCDRLAKQNERLGRKIGFSRFRFERVAFENNVKTKRTRIDQVCQGRQRVVACPERVATANGRAGYEIDKWVRVVRTNEAPLQTATIDWMGKVKNMWLPVFVFTRFSSLPVRTICALKSQCRRIRLPVLGWAQRITCARPVSQCKARQGKVR